MEVCLKLDNVKRENRPYAEVSNISIMKWALVKNNELSRRVLGKLGL